MEIQQSLRNTLKTQMWSLTLLVVRQLHVEGDAVRQRTQVLHQSVELPHQQDARLLGVAAGHRHLVAGNDGDVG